MTLISSMIRKFRGPAVRPVPEQAPSPLEVFTAPIAPTEPLCVIGDVHGRADLLEGLSRRIGDEAEPGTHIVLVGDYVDRGDASAAVLRMLMAEDTQTETRLTCLAGNHEEMMIAFLDDPQQTGSRWLRYGGLQTLASFGLRGISETMTGDDLERARDALREAMGPDLESWLRNLPVQVQSGNVAVVHAGADPDLPILQQSRKALLWGHSDFSRRVRSDGVWVAHGHTVVPEVCAAGGRIPLDTGAYATGRLSAAILAPDGDMRLLCTGAPAP